MADSQRIWLHWKEHYNQMTGFLFPFLEDGIFVDVILSCQAKSIRAHRLVLSACSPYFRKILVGQVSSENVVITFKELKFEVLHAMVQFMYCGRVQLDINDVTPFLKAAESFGINCFESPSPAPGYPSASDAGVFSNLSISNGELPNTFPFMQHNVEYPTSPLMLQHYGNSRPGNANQSPNLFQNAVTPFQQQPNLNPSFQNMDSHHANHANRPNVAASSSNSLLLHHLLQSQQNHKPLPQRPPFSSLRSTFWPNPNQFSSPSTSANGSTQANKLTMAHTSAEMASPASLAFQVPPSTSSAANIMQNNSKPGPSSSKGKSIAHARPKTSAKKVRGKPGPKPKATGIGIGMVQTPMIDIDSPRESPDFSLGDLINSLDIIIDHSEATQNTNPPELQRSDGPPGRGASSGPPPQLSLDGSEVSLTQTGGSSANPGPSHGFREPESAGQPGKRKSPKKNSGGLKQPRLEIDLHRPQNFVDNVHLTLEKIDQSAPRTRSQVRSAPAQDQEAVPVEAEPNPKDINNQVQRTGNGGFACGTCSKEYTKSEDALNHVLQRQCKAKNLECHVCQQRFTFRFGLKTHLKHKHKIMLEDDIADPKNGEERYNHDNNENRKSVGEAEPRVASQTESEVEPSGHIMPTCFRCGLRCLNIRILKEHLMMEHNLDKTLVQGLTGENQMNNESRTVKQRPVYHCSKCQAPFASKEKHRKHMKNGHCQRVACVECNKELCNRRTLKKHLIAVHGCTVAYVDSLLPKLPLAEPNVPCEACGKMFRFKTELKRHMTDECPDREGDPVQEEVPFVEVNGEKVDEPKYSCESCQADFDAEETLASHVKADECINRLVVPTVDVDSASEFIFTCENCQAKFFEQAVWLQHTSSCNPVKDDSLLSKNSGGEAESLNDVVNEIAALNNEDIVMN